MRFSIEGADGTPYSLDGTQTDALLFLESIGGRITSVGELPRHLVTNSSPGLSLATYIPVRRGGEVLQLPSMTFPVDNGVPELNEEKRRLVETLVNCGWSETDLRSKPLAALRQLAQQYAPVQHSSHEEPEVLPLPRMF